MKYIPDRDRRAIQISADTLGRIAHADVRKNRGGDPRWYQYTHCLMLKLERRGYAVKIADGCHVLTEAGKAWCGAANVANTHEL